MKLRVYSWEDYLRVNLTFNSEFLQRSGLQVVGEIDIEAELKETELIQIERCGIMQRIKPLVENDLDAIALEMIFAAIVRGAVNSLVHSDPCADTSKRAQSFREKEQESCVNRIFVFDFNFNQYRYIIMYKICT